MTSGPLWKPERVDAIYDVVGIGENSLDRVSTIERWPARGTKTEIVRSAQRPGGQVATAMLACARLGIRGAYLGPVADDSAAGEVLAPLEAAAVDLSSITRILETQTRVGQVFVERRTGERTVLGYRDPRLVLRRSAAERAVLERARVLVIDMVDPDASRWAAEIARSAGTAVVLDADGASDALWSLLPFVDFPIVSADFAESLGEGESPRSTLRALAIHAAAAVVVTLGRGGALALVGDRTIESPAFEVDVVDTTGAGDAFRGGFVWALVNGQDADDALRTANATAAMNCCAEGAQGGLPSLSELEIFLAQREGDRAG